MLCFATTATAQQKGLSLSAPTSTWEIEVHGGFGFFDFGGGTSRSLPAPGPTIATLPPAAFPSFPSSRAVPSWFFGDGTTLFNDFRTPLSSVPMLASLDSTITSLGATRSAGGTVGFRLARRLNRRWSIEFSVDDNFRSLAISSSTLNAVNAAGTSFIAAYNGVFSQPFLKPTNPNPIATVLNPVVTAVSTNEQASGSQLVTLVALTLRSSERKPVMPFLTLGAGLRSNRGPDSTVTLVGRYQFAFQLLGQGPLVPIDETDSLTIRYSDRGTSPVAIVGAGFKHYVTRTSGVRVDGQLLMGVNQLTVSIDAAPSHVVGSPAGTLAIESTSSHPALQFSTSPSFQSSLSAGLKGFETFTGGGFHLQASITIGYFFGF